MTERVQPEKPMETTLPPQPPPDVPAPPPGEEALRSRGKMKVILWIGSLSILPLLLLLVGAPLVSSQSKTADRFEALSNMRAVGGQLLEFDAEYGQFPDAATIREVKDTTGTGLALGSGSSNALFRQLIATGLKGEKIFWAKTFATPYGPDDVTAGAKALTKGECSFTYIAGLDSSADPDAPLLMTPVIPGTWKFDPKPFKRAAAVCFASGRTQSLPIDKNGDVILNGMNLFDPRQPYWKGKVPDIKWPE